MVTTIKRKIIICSLVLLFLSLPALSVNANEILTVTIDDAPLAFDVPPAIIEGRTLVPLRAIFQSLGADVKWDPETQIITANRHDKSIILQLGNKSAVINGQQVTLDVPPQSISGRTMVPARIIAEALGAGVLWEESSRAVLINSNLPYNLSSYHVLENNITQILNEENEGIYEELENQIRKMFNVESYTLLENYLRRTYPVNTFQNGTFTGKSTMSGQGIYEWGSGEKYIGDWLDTKMNGKGIYYWSDGSYYVGEWKENTKTGWGILKNSSGNMYIGEWNQNILSGRGIRYWPNGEKYRGQWKNDQQHGVGSYYWNSGNKISGQFVSGAFTGKGMYTWYTGEKYIGEFLNDKMNGHGKYYFQNGLIFCGEFTDENRESGTYITQEGNLFNLSEAASHIAGSLIKPDMSDLEKEKILHDYVIQNVEYDWQNYQNNTITVESHTAYGALINKTAVCDGYTELLHNLLKAAGIESIFVTGEANGNKGWEGHAWLIVKVDGHYSHLDVTWNDLDKSDALDYTYFNRFDAEMEKDHKWDREAYPVCTKNSASVNT